MLKFQKKLIVTRDIRNYLNERELFYEKQERESKHIFQPHGQSNDRKNW